MFKSTAKAFVLALLIFVSSIGATGFPSFLTVAVSKPIPTSPAGSTLLTTDSPTLKWKASTPAVSLDHYEYEVSTDSGFSSLADSGSSLTEDATTVPLDRSKTYFWRVKACDNVTLPPDDCTGWSATASFRVSLGAPTLVAPVDASTLETNRDKFEWNSVLNATGYTLQIAASSLFSTLLVQQDVTATVTEFTPTTDLPVNQILYWRVRAKSSTFGPGPWSDTWTFNTANPPSAPTLLQPKDKKMTTDHTPRLFWSEVTVPSATTFDYYQVQIDDNKDFSSTHVDDTTTLGDKTVTSYDVADPADELNAATTYYWRVRACNHDGPDNYCSLWTPYFTLYISLDAPSALISPADLTLLADNRPIFDWADVVMAANYTLQLSKDTTFTHPAFSWHSSISEYQPSTALPPGITYYWRVQANRLIYGPGLWSPVFSFTTANPPRKPVLKSPISSSLVTTTKPTLLWTYSTTPPGTIFDYYQVQIDTDPAFGAPIEDNTSNTNQYAPYFMDPDYSGTLNSISKYYWRVRACNLDALANPGCSEWSTVWNIRVAAEAPINLDSTAYPFLDWDNVPGASGYYVEIYKNGAVVKRLNVSTSDAFAVLPTGTYTWRVRVKSTFVPGYAPGAWSITDSFLVP
jgi:hypothetical protein